MKIIKGRLYLLGTVVWHKMALCPVVGKKHKCISSLSLPNQFCQQLSGNLYQ
jgi:hypothetical protein